MILSFSIKFSSLPQFLNHWSAKYRDPQFRDREKYDDYVGKPLTHESRLHLFEWKNGSKLSKQKISSIEHNYPLNFNRKNLRIRYLNRNATGGAIWNIFYMHCIDPKTWPIYDQHTHRAMHYMKTGRIVEIGSRKAEIYDSYESNYIPFVKSLNSDQRTIDKALYAFGQFLKIAKAYR
jgi:outer membrane cobalamin receptor